MVLHTTYDTLLSSYSIMGFNCKGCFCARPNIRDPGCDCECHAKVELENQTTSLSENTPQSF